MGEYNGVTGGVSGIVTNGFKPWWAGYEGTVDPIYQNDSLTAEQAFKLVLDWDVEPRDLHYYSFDTNEYGAFVRSELKTYDRKRLNVKADDNTVLGDVGTQFPIVQNYVLKEFAEILEQQGGVSVVSAGSLFDYSVVWMLLKMGEDKVFAGGDEHVKQYALLANGHGGTHSFSLRDTNTRTECMNTFAMNMNDAALFSIRHTASAEERIKEARRALEEVHLSFSRTAQEIDELLAETISELAYEGVCRELVGEQPDGEKHPRALKNWERRFEGLKDSWHRPDTENIKGTKWGALMAVNSFEQWDQWPSIGASRRAEKQAQMALRGNYPLTAHARQLVRA